MSNSLAAAKGGFFKFIQRKSTEGLARSVRVAKRVYLYLFFKGITDRYDHTSIQKDLVDLRFPNEGIYLMAPKEQILIALSKHFKFDYKS